MAARPIEVDGSAYVDWPKVELHCHMEGSIRPETALYYNKTGEFSNLQAFLSAVRPKEPETLTAFLARFAHFMPPLINNAEAIERIAFEYVEDCARQNIVYCEMRYCPSLLVLPEMQLSKANGEADRLAPADVVRLVQKGIERACAQYDVVCRQIVCCLRNFKGISLVNLALCQMFRDEISAIDLANDELLPLNEEDVHAFTEANRCRIHRTVHAGESGPGKHLFEAVEKLYAERIGHGYHIIDNEAEYEQFKRQYPNVLLEACPTSSYYTGVVKRWDQHPLKFWSEDNVKFCLNRDDPLLFGNQLHTDYDVASCQIGLCAEKLKQSVVDAVDASFCDEHTKRMLRKKVAPDNDD